MRSIEILARRFGDRALVGAGTVRTTGEVAQVAEAGGRLIVMPHADTAVIGAAKAQGLLSLPGFFTPTEGFAALAAGADGLKLFPAEAAPPPVLKALKAVLPKSAGIYPVGGISPERMADYRRAGAAGFGLGSALYKPGDDAAAVAAAARRFVEAWTSLGE
jgi:2-dehydro-3-deoxyphosphogalactonate aldolase